MAVREELAAGVAEVHRVLLSVAEALTLEDRHSVELPELLRALVQLRVPVASPLPLREPDWDRVTEDVREVERCAEAECEGLRVRLTVTLVLRDLVSEGDLLRVLVGDPERLGDRDRVGDAELDLVASACAPGSSAAAASRLCEWGSRSAESRQSAET